MIKIKKSLDCPVWFIDLHSKDTIVPVLPGFNTEFSDCVTNNFHLYLFRECINEVFLYFKDIHWSQKLCLFIDIIHILNKQDLDWPNKVQGQLSLKVL